MTDIQKKEEAGDGFLFLRLSKNKVIANQPEGWCGDHPVFAGNPGFLTKNVDFFMGDCHASVITGSQ